MQTFAKSAFGLVAACLLLILPSIVGFADDGVAAEPEGKQAGEDPVQKCLDDQRRTKTEPPSASPAPSRYTFREVPASALPEVCEDGDLHSLRRALKIQIANCDRQAPAAFSGPLRLGCRLIERQDWCKTTNRQLSRIAEDAAAKGGDFKSFMTVARQEFDWFKSNGRLDGDATIAKGYDQFTAYYDPAIEAQSYPDGVFKYPVYRRPADLVSLDKNDRRTCGQDPITGAKIAVCRRTAAGALVPYPARKEIASDQALDGRNLEIAWLKDSFDVYTLMLEGDGRLGVRDRDGGTRTLRLNYDVGNGRTRYLMGRVIRCMLDRDEAKKIDSMQAIGDYLAAHKDSKDDILNYDQFWAFFKIGDRGPLGVEGMELTPGVSLATDPRLLPPGSAILFDLAPAKAHGRICSMGLAQDIGGEAIKDNHVDLFVGAGSKARDSAGAMNDPGSIFVMVHKRAGRSIPGCLTPATIPQ